MIFKSLIDESLERLKLKSSSEDSRDSVKRKLNLTYKEIGNNSNYDWPHLTRYGEIRTVTNYTTGTVTITNGSRTVTGSSTVWTSAMEGRFFRPQSGNHWYKIIRVVSATELTLYSAITESSASDRTYTIWQRFYYFPTEVRKVLEFGSWIRDGRILNKSNRDLRDLTVDISNTGEPEEFVMYGSCPFESTYSTGTISISKDSTLLEGENTVWLANVEPGDEVEIGDDIYRVKRVESDTRIRLLNAAVRDVVSGTAYAVRKKDNLGFQLYFNPNSEIILPYTYSKYVYDMVNEDEDEPELPGEKFDEAIIIGTEAKWLRSRGDANWASTQNLYSITIGDLRRTSKTAFPQKQNVKVNIPNKRGAFI